MYVSITSVDYKTNIKPIQIILLQLTIYIGLLFRRLITYSLCITLIQFETVNNTRCNNISHSLLYTFISQKNMPGIW